MLAALLGVVGRLVTVQAWQTPAAGEIAQLPFLTVFGVLEGGPVEPIEGADAVLLNLMSASRASSGNLLLRRPTFAGADDLGAGRLQIRCGLVTVAITAAEPGPEPPEKAATQVETASPEIDVAPLDASKVVEPEPPALGF